MFKRFVIVAVLLGLVGAGLVGFDMFRKKMMGQVFAAMAAPPVSPVTVVTAKLEPVPQYLEGVGSLEAVKQVTITAEVGGKVTELNFEAGKEVTAGETLIRLNDAPERADLQRYQAQANLAALNLGRAEKLLKLATPQSSVDQFKSQLSEAKAAVAQVNAVIDQKQISAPFDGVLGIRQVNLGQFVSPGDPIVTLTDLSKLYVNFTLPEQALAQAKVGQEVEVAVDTFPDTKFLATINAIDPVVSMDTRTLKAQAVMDNPDSQLSPGMYVRAAVRLPEAPPAFIVPETAVEFSIYGDQLYVVRAIDEKDRAALQAAPTMPGAPPKSAEELDKVMKVERLFVKTGARFNGKATVIDGLKEGDKVITSGQVNLNPSSFVAISEDKSLAETSARKETLY